MLLFMFECPGFLEALDLGARLKPLVHRPAPVGWGGSSGCWDLRASAGVGSK
jgi:hypothetical protein